MGDDVSVEDCSNINFQKSELPSTMNVGVAKTVCVGQHVTVKAKVAKLKYQSKERQLWQVQHGTCNSCRPITFYKTEPLGKFCEQCSDWKHLFIP